LIDLGHAYVCTCDPENYKKLLDKGEACPCRELPPTEQMKRWKKMFKEYKEGEAVLRVKTDIAHKNPAMRDWPAARIKDTPHLRTGTKYRVWPLMNLSVVVDDIESGMTHIIRGKDHMDNAKKQEYVYRYLNKPIPATKFIGRINFVGGDVEVSCSKTKKDIAEGKFSGWEDIRLPFVKPLMRRGYRPEAFLKFAEEIGPSPNDKTVTLAEFFKTINAFNREVLDPIANRYFFVADPQKMTLKGAPKQDIRLHLHPDDAKRGDRHLAAHENFLLTKDDIKDIKEGKLYRLMDCVNFRKEGADFRFDSAEVEAYKKCGEKIFHWLPDSADIVNTDVMMPDGSKVSGLSEPATAKLKEGDIVQFERFGFCRLDKIEKDAAGKLKLIFWFTH
jgi:glutamyl-tRNA synthetase